MERERGSSRIKVGIGGGEWCLRPVKGVPTPRGSRRRWRLHYRVHGKSRVYKLMHVKSLEQNRPACIMERNAVRARLAGLFQAWRHPGSALEGRECEGRVRRSACDIINRYDIDGELRNVQRRGRDKGETKRWGNSGGIKEEEFPSAISIELSSSPCVISVSSSVLKRMLKKSIDCMGSRTSALCATSDSHAPAFTSIGALPGSDGGCVPASIT